MCPLVIYIKTGTLFLTVMVPSKKASFQTFKSQNVSKGIFLIYMLHLSLSPISALLSIPSASTSSSSIVFVLRAYAFIEALFWPLEKYLCNLDIGDLI